MSTGTITALYSRSRKSWDTKWCLTKRDHIFRKATAASCFLRATSCKSPSREPSLVSPARLFLLCIWECSVLASLMLRYHFDRQPGAIRCTSFRNSLTLLFCQRVPCCLAFQCLLEGVAAICLSDHGGRLPSRRRRVQAIDSLWCTNGGCECWSYAPF